ncbi:HU family DNA-binding protein [Pseudomonas sp. UMAB-40]|uniref:HU family DNA-binding protein n=1 Tax=Pseudomonas sp. UMAB-40 TaxID=1365407 RepID=UPI001C586BDB|nr:HU family DNA-binding protein [Pseudomonas sp. UMAB-40]
MNKSEMIDAIAEKADISKAHAAAALNGFIEAVTDELRKPDGEVVLVGFGTFRVASRAARVGRNPSTGKSIQIAASNVPGFKAGAVLKRTLNP